MKKIIMLLALCMMCLFSFVVNAEENKADNPMNWEISMMPKPTVLRNVNAVQCCI